MIYLKRFEIFGSGENASYDNDAGEPFWGNKAAGVLPICSITKKILLDYRSKYVNEPNTYGVYGGKIDTDENIEDAVRREFLEETEYDDNIELIPAFIFESGTFKYYNYIGIIDDEFEPKMGWESEDYEWVTFDELLNIEQKHPGLKLLLEDTESLKIIKKIIKQ